jgi:hypothetical protein
VEGAATDPVSAGGLGRALQRSCSWHGGSRSSAQPDTAASSASADGQYELGQLEWLAVEAPPETTRRRSSSRPRRSSASGWRRATAAAAAAAVGKGSRIGPSAAQVDVRCRRVPG